MSGPLEPPETAAPQVLHLLTGHLVEGPGYRAYRKHGTADHLLILTLEGAGRFGHAGGELQTGPGDLTLLAPHTRHDYGTQLDAGQGHWTLFWAHLQPRPHWLEWLRWPEVAPGLRQLRLEGEAFQAARTAFETCHQRALSGSAPREAQAMHALEGLLLGVQAGLELPERPLDPRIGRVLAGLETHFAEAWTLKRMAALAHLSPSRFSHLFRQELGLTPLTHLERLRLERAARLLGVTPLSVEGVALEVGFSDAFYFSRRFSRRFGRSPRAYRERG